MRPRATHSKHFVDLDGVKYIVLFRRVNGFWQGRVGLFNGKGNDPKEAFEFGDVSHQHPNDRTAEELVIQYERIKARDE